MEQIPGLVIAEDLTSVLQWGYWASYNIPYFPLIFNLSGYPGMFSLSLYPIVFITHALQKLWRGTDSATRTSWLRARRSSAEIRAASLISLPCKI